jgi:hypothetical protein
MQNHKFLKTQVYDVPKVQVPERLAAQVLDILINSLGLSRRTLLHIYLPCLRSIFTLASTCIFAYAKIQVLAADNKPRHLKKLPDKLRVQVEALELPQLESLSEASLDFGKIDDLKAWLKKG